jgi:hypothetical protein
MNSTFHFSDRQVALLVMQQHRYPSYNSKQHKMCRLRRYRHKQAHSFFYEATLALNSSSLLSAVSKEATNKYFLQPHTHHAISVSCCHGRWNNRSNNRFILPGGAGRNASPGAFMPCFGACNSIRLGCVDCFP